MIEAAHITKWYGPTLAVDDLSFSIPKGKIVGFLGPNGAGKSTTLRILTGYLPPTAGTATVAGHNVTKAAESARAAVGYMPENNPLYLEMRVEEFLQFRAKLFRLDKKTTSERIDTVCDRCGLSQLRRRVIGHLSKGNRQRVGLAQALLHNPKVLILDEPTAGLDPIQIVEIRKFLEELRNDHAILLSSHILAEIEKVADRIMIIRKGKMIADGTVDDLRGKAKGGSRVTVETQAEPSAVKSKLEKVAGVARVETSSAAGWCRAEITPKGEGDVREKVLAAVTAESWPTRGVGQRQVSLEDYYMQVFREMDEAEHKKEAKAT